MNTFNPAVDDVEALKQSIHDWIDTGASREYLVGQVSHRKNFDPPFQKAAVELMIDKMLEAGEIADDPDAPGFYVSSVYSPNTSLEWRQTKKWQHIEVGDVVMFKGSMRIVTISTIDYMNDMFWFTEDEEYIHHPLEAIIPENPAHKQFRLDAEEREMEAQIARDNVIAEWRDKRYNELKKLANSICHKRGHKMTAWAHDSCRCQRCFYNARIDMGAWGMDAAKTGIRGGAIETECR